MTSEDLGHDATAGTGPLAPPPQPTQTGPAAGAPLGTDRQTAGAHGGPTGADSGRSTEPPPVLDIDETNLSGAGVDTPQWSEATVRGDTVPVTPEEAERLDPERASAERAGETPPHADAEQMESALREGGPLAPADRYERQRREAASDPGGTSLT
jgi:hypothetical protein